MRSYLPGSDAPFGQEIFAVIQNTVLEVAKGQLGGRRLLEVEGPYGLGHKSFGLMDRPVGEQAQVGGAVARLKSAPTVPIPLLEATFELGIREVAGYEQGQAPFDLEPAVMAAIAMARAEDLLVFQGNDQLGLKGITNYPGVQSLGLGDWNVMGQPVEDIIKAVGMLEAKSLLGPYALALSPANYDVLFRRDQEAAMLQLQHLREIVTAGIVKSPALSAGGVLVAAGRPFASIVLGQDLTLGFVGPKDTGYELVIYESLATRVSVPDAVVVLT